MEGSPFERAEVFKEDRNKCRNVLSSFFRCTLRDINKCSWSVRYTQTLTKELDAYDNFAMIGIRETGADGLVNE